VFIYGMVLRCVGESGPVTKDLTTTVVHSYKLLINVTTFNQFTPSLDKYEQNYEFKVYLE